MILHCCVWRIEEEGDSVLLCGDRAIFLYDISSACCKRLRLLGKSEVVVQTDGIHLSILDECVAEWSVSPIVVEGDNLLIRTRSGFEFGPDPREGGAG